MPRMRPHTAPPAAQVQPGDRRPVAQAARADVARCRAGPTRSERCGEERSSARASCPSRAAPREQQQRCDRVGDEAARPAHRRRSSADDRHPRRASAAGTAAGSRRCGRRRRKRRRAPDAGVDAPARQRPHERQRAVDAAAPEHLAADELLRMMRVEPGLAFAVADLLPPVGLHRGAVVMPDERRRREADRAAPWPAAASRRRRRRRRAGRPG